MDLVATTVLSPEVAVAVGRIWIDELSGTWSAVLARVDGVWKLVHEHESYDPADPTS